MSKLKAKWPVPTEETPQQHIRMLRRRLDNKILNSWLRCDDVNKPPSVQHSLMKWQTKITLAYHTIPYSQYLDVEFVFWPLIKTPSRHPLLRQAHHRLIIPGCMSLAFWGPVGICPPESWSRDIGYRILQCAMFFFWSCTGPVHGSPALYATWWWMFQGNPCSQSPQGKLAFQPPCSACNVISAYRSLFLSFASSTASSQGTVNITD